MKYIEYNENKKHGTDDFPIEYYYVDREHPQYEMTLHWHQEFEILRIKSGSFQLFIDNVEYRLTRGDIAFISCCSLHRGIPSDCQYECVVLNLNMLRKKASIIERYILPIINRSLSVNVIYPFQNNVVTSSISALMSCLKNKTDYYPLEAYGLLYGIFLNMYRQSIITENAVPIKNNRQIKIITEVIDWIEVHYQESVTLKQLAEISKFNEKYFCHIFKNYTSKTPMEYINQLRIENACHDLLHTNLSITETAFSNGFNNLNYFTKLFKKYKKLTPREYKKLHS